MPDPSNILGQTLARASANLSKPLVRSRVIQERADYVCRCLRNRAGARLLMACLLAKIDNPKIDPRKPYTEIKAPDAFSGRTYDEIHLKSKNSSRLPVLVVAAAYQVVGDKVDERLLPLRAHNAADEQTGAMGDVEICLANEDNVVTVYEMKKKRVTPDDINRALQKIASAERRIHNYIFITTDVIDDQVKTYATEAYERTGGTEIAILDCLGFLRHFLHFFHRLRIAYLDAYQALLLAEPDSAVSQPLKEAFLALRQAAKADE